MEFEETTSDLELAIQLQNETIGRSTHGFYDDRRYQYLRKKLLDNSNYKDLLPSFVRTHRSLEQFWPFIKNKFSTYAERKVFIYREFSPLLDYIEGNDVLPPEKSIDDALSKFDAEGVHFAWTKALERKDSNPEGAITISRTIIESVCKHILLDLNVDFNSSSIELSDLYKLTATELNMSPEQHSEKIFKQILGGCSGIINGLGTLRNKHGDAHGKLRNAVKPKPRHAELAVNLAGTMALFLIQTAQSK